MALTLQSSKITLAGARADVVAPRAVSAVSRTAAPVRVASGSVRAVPAAFPCTPLSRRKVSTRPVAAAKAEANFDEGIAGVDDYSPLLAALTYAAVWFNKFSVDKVKVLHALAALQLFVTAVNLVSRYRVGDQVATFVGPATLAAAILSIRHVAYLDVATALFGYFLSGNLEGITGIPFWGFVATLAVALYLGYGTLWFVIAFALASAGKVYNSTKDNAPLPLAVVPAVFASAWAIWKKQHFQLALSIYLALTVWSGFGAVHGLVKKLQNN